MEMDLISITDCSLSAILKNKKRKIMYVYIPMQSLYIKMKKAKITPQENIALKKSEAAAKTIL